MDYVELSRSALRVSRLGLGTVQFGLDYGYTKALAQGGVDAILGRCVELGVDLLDTAREYGESESKIGSFLRRNPAARFVLGTKARRPSAEESRDPVRFARSALRSAERSLEALGASRLDIFYLHDAGALLALGSAASEAAARVRDSSLVGLFGLSVYDVEEAGRVLDACPGEIDVLQVPLSVFDQRFLALEERLKRERVGMIARSVFLKGLIPAPEASVPRTLAGLLPYKRRLAEFAREAGLSVSELALLFAVAGGGADAALVGVASAEELSRDAATLDLRGRLADLLPRLHALAAEDRFLTDPRRWPKLAA